MCQSWDHIKVRQCPSSLAYHCQMPEWGFAESSWHPLGSRKILYNLSGLQSSLGQIELGQIKLYGHFSHGIFTSCLLCSQWNTEHDISPYRLPNNNNKISWVVTMHWELCKNFTWYLIQPHSNPSEIATYSFYHLLQMRILDTPKLCSLTIATQLVKDGRFWTQVD